MAINSTGRAIHEVMNEEVMLLFDDLVEAMKQAGQWSIRCDSLLDRAAELVGVGATPPELRATQLSAAQHADIVKRIHRYLRDEYDVGVPEEVGRD